MQPTTLRGIFPERKIPHRKNFIKENVKNIRQIQDTIKNGVSDVGVNHDRQLPKHELKGNLTHSSSQHKINDNAPNHYKTLAVKKPAVEKLDFRSKLKNGVNTTEKLKREIKELTHRSTQTELGDNVDSIYSKGVIKYPSPALLVTVSKNKKFAQKKELGHGDSPRKKDVNHKPESENKVDFVKQNMAQMKPKVRKELPDKGQAPANYKRGVVPKYIKNKKDVLVEEAGDIECPAGHVLLPDEERKETLRVLRESYAEKVQELNAMPVRSDTLRMQKRKIELEQDLKKIDEGIKVFQRPKVFVKINV